MRTTRFLLILIGWGGLTLGSGFAAEPSRPTSNQEARQNHSSSSHPAEPLPGSREQTEKIHALLNSLRHVQPRSSQTGPLHISKETVSAANAGRIMNKTAGHPIKAASYHELLAKLPVGRETAVPVSTLVHGRSLVAAAVGGPSASSAKTSLPGLNGASLKHKP
jgi:hypothetical protein